MASHGLFPLDQSYLDANRVLFSSLTDTGEYLERRDAAIVSSGLPVQLRNWGFVKPGADARSAVEWVRDYFGSRRLPFRLTFSASDAERCRADLEALGWRAANEPTPAMTLPLARVTAPPSGLEIEEGRSAPQLVEVATTAPPILPA